MSPKSTLESVQTREGDRVVFDRHGAVGAPAALFIQGAGPTRADDPVTAETAQLLAARGFQALVHDRIGRGESPAAGPIPLERELDAIGALAESAAGPVVLVGHSSGCAIAMLAASRVERLAGLVLWEAPLGQFPDGAPAWWAEVERHLDAGELEQAVAAYMVDMPPEWIEELQRSPDYPGLVQSWIPDGEALAAVESRGAAASIGELEVPVLAVVGAETFPGMGAAADAIAAAAPHGLSEELAGAWHSWDPEAMSARLAVLLAG
ncbi:alpha/beta hydrolase [Agromyces italicus]|uniref:alpha/beta hydrolase n=1 Tax=Agromyces italicus TaxID=279572 RepID=UPI0003B594A1|nr:alpha/beta hydrolase [Agromyces italicus]